MSNNIPKGSAITVTMAFRKPYPSFAIAPIWEVFNPQDVVILSGTTVPSAITDHWDAVITIPTTYVSASGNEELSVEFSGTDTNNFGRSTQREYQLLDVADSFIPAGVMMETSQSYTASFILEADTYVLADFKIDFTAFDGTVLNTDVSLLGLNVNRVANLTDVPDRFTEFDFQGYRYDVVVPVMSLQTETYGPYQMFFKYTDTSTSTGQIQFLPAYPWNAPFIRHINNLKLYLDKARLQEIDPTLQWQTEELAHALLEGFAYVNAFPATFTYWTPENSPTPMYTYIWYAAAVYALNSRYIAEGMNAFQFSGASTTLDFDRRDTLTYKIEELKGFLETNLKAAKKAAIRAFGPGNAPASAKAAINVGVLGLQSGQSTNALYNSLSGRRSSYLYGRYR